MLKSSRSVFWKIWALESRECKSGGLWLPVECGYLWADNPFAPDTQGTRGLIFLFSALHRPGWKWTPSPADFAETDCWRLLINGLYDRKMPYFLDCFDSEGNVQIILPKIKKFMSSFDLLSWRMSQQLHISRKVVLWSLHTLVKMVFVMAVLSSNNSHIFNFPDEIGGIWLFHNKMIIKSASVVKILLV